MKKLLTSASLLIIMLAVSCSSVFYGNVSGRLVDMDTKTGIENATVYLYTDKGARDSAFNSSRDSGKAPSSGFYASDITDQSGSFSINKVYWKTNSPDFGKTADTNEMYLLFYKEGYGENGFAVNRNKVTVISESSGNMVNEELERKYNVTNITLTVSNILTGTNISEPLSTTITSERKDVDITKINDSSYKVIADKNLDDPAVTITWEFRDKAAKYIPTDEDGINLTDKQTTAEVFYDRGSITLYAKPTEFAYPVISGQLITRNADKTVVDGVEIKLFCGNDEIAGTTTGNSPIVQGDDSNHGTFTLEPSETEKWTNTTYEGKRLEYTGEELTIRFTDPLSGEERSEAVSFSSNELIRGSKQIAITIAAEETP